MDFAGCRIAGTRGGAWNAAADRHVKWVMALPTFCSRTPVVPLGWRYIYSYMSLPPAASL
ncbi:MAG: hypothetical protein U1F25_15165 [Rubrivivax sp.]